MIGNRFNGVLKVFNDNISPDIILNMENMQLFYQKYIFILLSVSTIIYILTFWVFDLKKNNIKNKCWKEFIISFQGVLICELFYVTMPFKSLKIIFYILSKVFFINGMVNTFLIINKNFSWESLKKINNKKILISLGIILGAIESFLVLNLELKNIYEKIIFFSINNLYLLFSIFLFLYWLKNFFKTKKIIGTYFYLSFFNLLNGIILFLEEGYVYNNYYTIGLMLSMVLNLSLQKNVYLEETEKKYKEYINLLGKNLIFNYTIALFSTFINYNTYLVLLIFFLIFIEMAYYLYNFNKLLIEYNSKSIISKLRLINSVDLFLEYFEKEVKEIFHVEECKLLILRKNPIENSSYKFDKYPYYNENIEFEGKIYDLGLKLIYLNNQLGMVFIRDKRILFYKKKLRELQIFLENISFLLDNLLLKNLHDELATEECKKLQEKNIKISDELFYTKEILKIISKKNTIEEIKKIIDNNFQFEKRDYYE
ncbi:hypothetical protein [Cetobacterium sp. SF1]|uniref:hypothetical protein n=1 Tax=Cetobacterium sp. SF1 TaxID=3417654 RepID=UPI003CE7A82E